jgi:hypothetical protein
VGHGEGAWAGGVRVAIGGVVNCDAKFRDAGAAGILNRMEPAVDGEKQQRCD